VNIVFEVMRVNNIVFGETLHAGHWLRGDPVAVRKVGHKWHDQVWRDDPAETDPDTLTCSLPLKCFVVVTGYPQRTSKRMRQVWTEAYTADGDTSNRDLENALGRREWQFDLASFSASIQQKIKEPPHTIVLTWEQVKANVSGRRHARTISDVDTV
jgi:hypothetical protein